MVEEDSEYHWEKPPSKYYDEALPLDVLEREPVRRGQDVWGGDGYGMVQWRARHGLVAGLFLVLLVLAIGWRLGHPVPRVQLSPIVGSMRVDVNTAEADLLCVIQGIGPKIAERIIEDRQANGPFGSVDELQRVHGIGAKTIVRMREFIIAGSVHDDTLPE